MAPPKRIFTPVITSKHPAFEYCQALMDRKGEDYGGGIKQDDARIEYHPLGEVSYYQMLHTKMKRIESMIKLQQAGKEPNFESLQDSVADLINYASFFWAFLNDKETKNDGRSA